jgi:hypothetical protein
MIKKAAIAAGFVLLFSAGSSGQWIVPQPDCCPRIYDTGRWLGWATALLQHACDVGRYEPQETIIDCLRNAGLNAAAAYSACSSGVPAWPDYTHKQLWLAGHTPELRHPGNSTKYRETRWELVSSAISTTYGQWAGDLSWEKVDGQMLNRKTCAACFFQLGFDLACATQAYREALAANADRDLQTTIRELNRTRLRLRNALAVLDAYQAIQGRSATVPGCPDIGESDLAKRIREITLTAPSVLRAAEELSFVSRRSDALVQILGANCTAGARPQQPLQNQGQPPRQPPGQNQPPASHDPGELAGDWAIHLMRWESYIGPDWPSLWAGKAGEHHSQALVVHFASIGGNEYEGVIQRPPANEWWIHPFDDFGKRTFLYRQGIRLLRLRKVGPNSYQGTHQKLGIPGGTTDPDQAWNSYFQNCVIVVFGNAAKLISPAASVQPIMLERERGTGNLLIRVGAGR